MFDASTSAGSNTNTSTNNTSGRNLSVQSQQQHQQHDGDPFHRRSCAATMTTIHGSKEDMEALIPPELKSSIRSGNDSEVNGSGRNRNNLSLSAPLSGGKLASAASAAAAVEPRLLHP